LKVLQRLSVDLRNYAPNNAMSIRPVFGRSASGGTFIYAVTDMTDPHIPSADTTQQRNFAPPFFRGFTAFRTDTLRPPFTALPIAQDTAQRLTVGPQVALSTPSITTDAGDIKVLLPSYPSNFPAQDITQKLQFGIESDVTPPGNSTNPNQAYLIDVELGSSQTGDDFFQLDSVLFHLNQRPAFRPLHIQLNRNNTSDKVILLAEEYPVSESPLSSPPALYLLDQTFIDSLKELGGASPALAALLRDEYLVELLPQRKFSFTPQQGQVINGHSWSIAVGDVDGISPLATNVRGYPRNNANEIVVTQSTPNQEVAGNRLSILRFRTDLKIPSPYNSQDTLSFFDTVVSVPMPGWVAAVTDFDGDFSDYERDEIFVVNKNDLYVLRLRDYASPGFIGSERAVFDTLYHKNFAQEIIRSVRIVDMEGDQLNDILVTTERQTYLLGRVNIGDLEVTIPARSSQTDPAQRFCDGATATFEWRNIIGGIDTVNIYFQPYLNNAPVGSRVTLALKYPNRTDSTTPELIQYEVNVEPSLISGLGRLIVESDEVPEISDSSAIVEFGRTFVEISDFTQATYRVGETVQVTGISQCVDAVGLEWQIYNSTTSEWRQVFPLQRITDVTNGTFSFDFTFPCDRQFDYLCAEPVADSSFFFRVIGYTDRDVLLRDTSEYGLQLLPNEFTVTVDTPVAASPQRFIRWDPDEIPISTNPSVFSPCNTIFMTLSLDSGRTFERLTVLDSAAIATRFYLWNPPPELPDSVIFRLCCEQAGCIIGQAAINFARPKYVNIVAPNPFDPLTQDATKRGALPGVNVIYTVPTDINVTISIYDQSNRLVAQPVVSQLRLQNTTYSDSWDGFLSSGEVAPNGMYYLVLESENGDREVYPVYVASGY
jgi:hypothetical protein